MITDPAVPAVFNGRNVRKHGLSKLSWRSNSTGSMRTEFLVGQESNDHGRFLADNDL